MPTTVSKLLAAAAALALAAPAAARVEGDAVVLGSAISLTGKHAPQGKSVKDGYDLAIKEINTKGGVRVGGKSYKLQIKYYDDESSPKRTAELLERLVKQDGVTFILGPYGDDATRSAAAAAERLAVPIVEADASAPAVFQQGYRNVFGTPTGAGQTLAGALALAADTARRNGRRPAELRIALASAGDPRSVEVRRGALELAAKYGMQVVVDDTLPKDADDMKATLAKVKALAPDALLVSGRAGGAATAARQIAAMGVRVPLVVMTDCRSADLAGIGQAAEGIVCPEQWSETARYRDRVFGSAMDYYNTFRATFREYDRPPAGAAQASAAVEVWRDAFERAQSFDTARLRDALAATDLDTFYGHIRFDRAGANVGTPIVLRQIRNGAYAVVAPPRIAARGVTLPVHASR